MDATFIWFIICVVVGVVVTSVGFSLKRTKTVSYQSGYSDRKEKEVPNLARKITRNIGFGILCLAAFLLFWSSFTVVQTKQVAVVTVNGKPESVLHNGWNWKDPIAQAHKFNGAIQTEKYSTDKDDQGDPITVRLFTGAQAQVNVTFQWQLEGDDNFMRVFQNYRDIDNLNKNVVKRNLQQSLNEVFASYNPYDALIAAQANTGTNTPATQQVAAIPYEKFQGDAMSKLSLALTPQGIKPISLTISNIHFDDKTQSYLDTLSQALVNTQIAIQNEKTAAATAESNRILNSQPANSQTVQQLCIQVTQKVLEEGHTLPAGWSCSGASSSVVIPSK